MSLEEVLGFEGLIHVVDIGAAAIAEVPPYKVLLDHGLARLSAVDGDARQHQSIVEAYGSSARIFDYVIADGQRHLLHLARPESGMSSILKPSKVHLAFFNDFERIGEVERVVEVDTVCLADIGDIQQIDYLKMDVQGAELMVLENAGQALESCIAIQLEASFIPLYEDQPSFGDIDQWMRRNGFYPHCFAALKGGSIAPTVINNDPRIAVNQLLECDIVYFREMIDFRDMSDEQVTKIALVSGYCYHSPDLCLHAVAALEQRGSISSDASAQVMSLINSGALRIGI